MTCDQSAIWPMHEAFYIQSMLFNSMSATVSITRLDRIFEKLDESPAEKNRLPQLTKVILNEFQNIVVQAGALSRYFWPVPAAKGLHQRRGEFLRELFSLDDTSPLRDRCLRNALEHFDERLDTYLAEGIVGYIRPEYVGPKPSDGGVPSYLFRAYFADIGTFCLLDEEFLMQPLEEAVIRVHHQLVKMEAIGRMVLPD